MARTAADVLADRLIDWNVRVIFGMPDWKGIRCYARPR